MLISLEQIREQIISADSQPSCELNGVVEQLQNGFVSSSGKTTELISYSCKSGAMIYDLLFTLQMKFWFF